jgi:hypothetical protein
MSRLVVNLFVQSQSDQGARDVLKVLGVLTKSKLVGVFHAISAGEKNSDSSFRGIVFSSEGEKPCDVLTQLAETLLIV